MRVLSKKVKTTKKSRYEKFKSIDSLLLGFIFFILICFGFALLLKTGITNI